MSGRKHELKLGETGRLSVYRQVISHVYGKIHGIRAEFSRCEVERTAKVDSVFAFAQRVEHDAPTFERAKGSAEKPHATRLPVTGVKHEGLTDDEVPCTFGAAMTTAVPSKFFSTRAIADIVIQPRGRRMSWKVAGKYDRAGKQRGPI